MAIFGRRDSPEEMLIDTARIQELIDEINTATTKLEAATKELVQARKDLERSTHKLVTVTQRGTAMRMRNSYG